MLKKIKYRTYKCGVFYVQDSSKCCQIKKRRKTMIKNTMQANSELEKAIRDRIETGFKNWNGGYDGWLE